MYLRFFGTIIHSKERCIILAAASFVPEKRFIVLVPPFDRTCNNHLVQAGSFFYPNPTTECVRFVYKNVAGVNYTVRSSRYCTRGDDYQI